MKGVTEPQLSPGGQWWWTGNAWVAAAEHPGGIAALAAQSAPSAPLVPAQPAAPTPVVPVTVAPSPAGSHLTAGAAIALPPGVPEPVVEAPGFRPAGWMPPADPVAAAAAAGPPPRALAQYAKPAGLAVAAVAAVGLFVGVVLPAIHHTQKAVATTVNKPIVAAANIELKAVATNAAQAEAAAFAESNTYVGMPGLLAQGYRSTKGVTLTVVAADADHFCFKLAGLAKSVAWYDSKTSLVSSRACH
ncbi:MAG: hypothetical protein JWO22_1455 [Frankiales bacterium]|nr:hypothetical protein [Frankiales bacterium]